MNINTLNKITAKIADPIEIVKQNIYGKLTTIPGMLNVNTGFKIKKSMWPSFSVIDHSTTSKMIIDYFVEKDLKYAGRSDMGVGNSRLVGIILNQLSKAYLKRSYLSYIDVWYLIHQWTFNGMNHYDKDMTNNFLQSDFDNLKTYFMYSGLAFYTGETNRSFYQCIMLTKLGQLVVNQLGIDKIMIPERMNIQE